jgi:folylpolyglutamate synthase/dihydropteroate synthase
MIIKEYPPIMKDGKPVVLGTDKHDIIQSFNDQLEKRGVECLTYFVDNTETKPDDNEYPDSGIVWSENFSPEDLMDIVLNYAQENMTKHDMLMFGAQLQNLFLAMEEEEVEEYDDDDEY